MLISDLEQFEIFSASDLIRGGFILSIDPKNGIINLQSDDGQLLLSEPLPNHKPITTDFSWDGLRGILTAFRKEGKNSILQSVLVSGETPTGGRFSAASTFVSKGN